MLWRHTSRALSSTVGASHRIIAAPELVRVLQHHFLLILRRLRGIREAAAEIERARNVGRRGGSNIVEALVCVYAFQFRRIAFANAVVWHRMRSAAGQADRGHLRPNASVRRLVALRNDDLTLTVIRLVQ